MRCCIDLAFRTPTHSPCLQPIMPLSVSCRCPEQNLPPNATPLAIAIEALTTCILPSNAVPQKLPIFDNPALYEKLDAETLFFIFYNQPGSYQQFLAARELKRQAWRYHKQHGAWFQVGRGVGVQLLVGWGPNKRGQLRAA
jgi:CCR4-NOT transcriptional regulation complex NOT5 subunit